MLTTDGQTDIMFFTYGNAVYHLRPRRWPQLTTLEEGKQFSFLQCGNLLPDKITATPIFYVTQESPFKDDSFFCSKHLTATATLLNSPRGRHNSDIRSAACRKEWAMFCRTSSWLFCPGRETFMQVNSSVKTRLPLLLLLLLDLLPLTW